MLAIRYHSQVTNQRYQCSIKGQKRMSDQVQKMPFVLFQPQQTITATPCGVSGHANQKRGFRQK